SFTRSSRPIRLFANSHGERRIFRLSPRAAWVHLFSQPYAPGGRLIAMRNSILSLILFVAAPAWSLASPGSPLDTLKERNGAVDKLLHQKTEVGSAAEKKQKAEIRAMAGDLLDYNELTKRAMAEHWDKITSTQQSDLVATLKELIERNYV